MGGQIKNETFFAIFAGFHEINGYKLISQSIGSRQLVLFPEILSSNGYPIGKMTQLLPQFKNQPIFRIFLFWKTAAHARDNELIQMRVG